MRFCPVQRGGKIILPCCRRDGSAPPAGCRIVFRCRGGGPPGVAWRNSLACPSLRGPILSARAERIGRKARQREGLFTKPPFPLESHPPKFVTDARLTHYRARSRPPAVPRNRTLPGMSLCKFDGASHDPYIPTTLFVSVGNGLDRSAILHTPIQCSVGADSISARPISHAPVGAWMGRLS